MRTVEIPPENVKVLDSDFEFQTDTQETFTPVDCESKDFRPRDIAISDLGISESTYHRLIKFLRKKLTKQEFDYQPGEGGLSESAFKVTQKYLTLRRLGMSEQRAIQKIRIEGA